MAWRRTGSGGSSAAVLVGAELVTGTFYLLAVGVAFAIGGVAALLGASFEIQLVVAGVVAIAGIFLAHRWRRRAARRRRRSRSFDIGQTVRVQALESGRHGARRLPRHAVAGRARGPGHRRAPTRCSSSACAARRSSSPTASA